VRKTGICSRRFRSREALKRARFARAARAVSQQVSDGSVRISFR
jgi:hypothetical protein